MRNYAPHLVTFALVLIAAAATTGRAATCESLASTSLPHTTIRLAESVPAGTFKPPYGDSLAKLPAFCRVAGVIKPTSDSYIRFEVWLPASGWNGRFLGVGNGGFAGAIGYNSMGENLKRGYATAGTDTGHEGDAEDASWAFQHPEKVKDFGYRGLHETVVAAKALVQALYSKPASHSYFDSCSDGGREALMEAQRFPEDFDGILAGAPANNWTHMVASGVATAKALYGDPRSYISAQKIPAINEAVLAACDAQDGVKDGIVSDPERCHFNPEVLLCKGPESRTCLTSAQIDSLKKLYSGAYDRHGQQIFPGFVPGSETGQGGWGPWVLGAGPGSSYGAGYVENYFRYMVFDDPAWNSITGNVDVAQAKADQTTGQALNAVDADLHRFQARGGRLILYHGWNDPAISPWNTISYYKNVVQTMGDSTAQKFVRLYMVPGMQHCVGGPGPNWFGQLGTVTAKGPDHGVYAMLEQWVEHDTAPGEVIATKYKEDKPANGVQMTRPLCPYPQVAKYKGSGDTNDYTSFVCAAP